MDSGQKFGKLTAIRPDPEHPRKWVFRCECGKEKSILTYNVVSGHTTSCGCLRAEQSRKNGSSKLDITGQKFGKLTVVRYLGKSTWECRCECGKITTVRQSNLMRKKRPTTSCGCASTLDAANASNFVEGTSIGAIKSQTLSKRNTSGVKGVYFCKTRQLWIANIGFQGKQYVLKCSTDKEECIRARKEAEERIFGDFLAWYEAKAEE